MKALRFYCKNDVRLEDIPEPFPSENEVKIKISYAGMCATDIEEFLYGPFFTPGNKPHPLTGNAVPIVLSHEFSGQVSDVGKNVTKVKPGDKVWVLSFDGECVETTVAEPVTTYVIQRPVPVSQSFSSREALEEYDRG